MKKAIDIHDFDSRLRSAEKLVVKSNPISEKNALLIQKFENNCFTEGLSKSRITKYVYTLRKLVEWMDKDFDEAHQDDIEELVNFIERRDYSAWTKHDYKVAIKRFYK